MGTPDFAVPSLRALLELKNDFQVSAVFTQPDRPVGRGLGVRSSPVKIVAEKHGIPTFQPEKLSGAPEVDALRELSPDVMVVVAYGQILRQEVLDLPRLGCVNVHSSLLPRWRGAAPIQWAILAGDQKTGVSTMKLVQKLDAGDILLQKETQITQEDTAGTLHDRLAQLGAELIGPTLRGLDSGEIIPRKQDEAQVTYAAKLNKEMEWLDAGSSAKELDRKVRALAPWPGTSVRVHLSSSSAPERLKIKSAVPHPSLTIKKGLIEERAGMVLLGTQEGSLELRRVQWEGKKEADASGFLNGLKGRGISLPLETV